MQRPFHPADSGECHVYLLHPPGGMVSGDRLNIEVTVGDSARALLTTPSAGKLYRGDSGAASQCQIVDCRVSGDGCLEWLPQETIVFDGARGELVTRVELDGLARCAVWDVVCLGRPASGETFSRGFLRQSLEIHRDGVPLYREHNRFVGGSPLLEAPWGLYGRSVTGSFLLSIDVSREVLEELRAMLADGVADSDGEAGRKDAASPDMAAISQLDGLLVVRYLGCSAERCRALFSAVWQRLRFELCGLVAVEPRIWRT